MKDILDKKLIIVSGKGGVGKTVVASSLAMACSKLEKKTLIIEANIVPDSFMNLKMVFNNPQIGYKPVSVSRNLFVSSIDMPCAMEEYLLTKIKSKFIYDKIFKRGFIQHLFMATPGFREMFLLGKVYFEAKNLSNNNFDIVIWDAPPIGSLELYLKISDIIYNLVRFGSIHNDAKEIENFIKSEKTMLTLVTTLEELPVQEISEFYSKLNKLQIISLGLIFENMCLASFFDEKEIEEFKKILDGKDYFSYEEYLGNEILTKVLTFYGNNYIKIQEKMKSSRKTLDNIEIKRIQLPLIFENEPFEVVQKLASLLIGKNNG
jgi:anion-transporting  ArsA/GET3 family ATPase